jgi:hypothetical protein
MNLDRALYVVENMSGATHHGELQPVYDEQTGRVRVLRGGERDARIRWNGRDGMTERQFVEFAQTVEVEHNRVSTRGLRKSFRRAFGRQPARV